MDEQGTEIQLAPVASKPDWKRRFKVIGLSSLAVLFLVFIGFNREQIEINFLFGTAKLQGGIMFLLIFLVGFLLGRGYSLVVRKRGHD